MARSRRAQPTLETIFFATPEQKLLRTLLAEPNTTFNLRAIASKLKGVRGLGGTAGINRILDQLHELGMIDYLDNKRAVRLREETPAVQILKTFSSVCDLEGLSGQLRGISQKGILYGCRADGSARSDSEYDLVVVSETPDEVQKVTSQHPIGRYVQLLAFTPEAYGTIEKQNPVLAKKLARGIVVWGASW